MNAIMPRQRSTVCGSMIISRYCSETHDHTFRIGVRIGNPWLVLLLDGRHRETHGEPGRLVDVRIGFVRIDESGERDAAELLHIADGDCAGAAVGGELHPALGQAAVRGSADVDHRQRSQCADRCAPCLG